ncbi:MAG: insulinase family protein [Clostridia bacterium]|nr:insulinase family protein [Clostridia bacterium]
MSELTDRFDIRYDELTKETVYYTTHPTGVKIAICPKPELKSSYAVFGTKYGSIDNDFSIDGGEFLRVPDGLAHYLEHKLFENEDCEAFEKYSKIGACANAYTGFDKTCYLFSCTREFEQAFRILLDFVQNPFFTEESVRKEQGIIAQEIDMYRDNPGWHLFFNLMKSMYREHPIRNDIAGTAESIAQITPELLYQCYEAFYNPDNMVLSVAGNVDPLKVLEMCDELLLPKQRHEIVSRCPEDDGTVAQPYVECRFDVPMPLFQLGFKKKYRELTERERVLIGIVRSAVFGPVSDFYTRMMNKQLIGSDFAPGFTYLRGVFVSLFQGMSCSPEAIRDEIFEEIERVKRNGISPRVFECVRRSSYGGQILMYNNPDDIAENLLGDLMTGTDVFKGLKAASTVTVDEGNQVFSELFDISNSTLSVVRPCKEA